MTDTPTPASTLDPQDPLPEANWFWRRVFVFVATAAIFAILIGLAVATNRIVGNVVGRIDSMDAQTVAGIAKQALTAILIMFRLMFWALMVTVTYYMVAPSAEQITKMMQTAGLLKAGVQFASRAVETPDRREVAATAGQPPQPVAPPSADGPADNEPTTREISPVGRDSGSPGPDTAKIAEDAPTGLPAPSAGLDPAAIVKGV